MAIILSGRISVPSSPDCFVPLYRGAFNLLNDRFQLPPGRHPSPFPPQGETSLLLWLQFAIALLAADRPGDA